MLLTETELHTYTISCDMSCDVFCAGKRKPWRGILLYGVSEWEPTLFRVVVEHVIL